MVFIKVLIIDSNKCFGHILSSKITSLAYINLIEVILEHFFMLFLKIFIIVLVLEFNELSNLFVDF
jgi:hypothetical protein